MCQPRSVRVWVACVSRPCTVTDSHLSSDIENDQLPPTQLHKPAMHPLEPRMRIQCRERGSCPGEPGACARQICAGELTTYITTACGTVSRVNMMVRFLICSSDAAIPSIKPLWTATSLRKSNPSSKPPAPAGSAGCHWPRSSRSLPRDSGKSICTARSASHSSRSIKYPSHTTIVRCMLTPGFTPSTRLHIHPAPPRSSNANNFAGTASCDAPFTSGAACASVLRYQCNFCST